MTIENKAIKLLHRKEWQAMTSAPAASAAGSFVIDDNVSNIGNLALLVVNATTHYLYHHDEDAFVQIASGALAGTFGAGACGARVRWSATVTANGGSTTSVTTTAPINDRAVGKKLRVLTGVNAGREVTIDRVLITPGGTSTIFWTGALPSAMANADTFMVSTGRFFVLSAGTLAAGAFKFYDNLTSTWSANLPIVGIPATWGTDGRMISTAGDEAFESSTSTGAGTSTTLVNAGKTWAVNQWANYQVRITAGTGIGQTRVIASNTGTTLTVSAAWTVNPDATSVYAIEGNEDALYVLGNNAVAMYRYSISANTWTTLAPGVARAGAPVAGMTAAWVAKTDDVDWADVSNIRDGRYIYSFRGGGTALDRYDIAANTWLAITYGPIAETFAAGSASAQFGRYIYLRKDATNRFFKYSVRGNYLEPLSTNPIPDGVAVLGDKIWIKELAGVTGEPVAWLYSLRNTGQELHRLMLI